MKIMDNDGDLDIIYASVHQDDINVYENDGAEVIQLLRLKILQLALMELILSNLQILIQMEI